MHKYRGINYQYIMERSGLQDWYKPLHLEQSIPDHFLQHQHVFITVLKSIELLL